MDSARLYSKNLYSSVAERIQIHEDVDESESTIRLSNSGKGEYIFERYIYSSGSFFTDGDSMSRTCLFGLDPIR